MNILTRESILGKFTLKREAVEIPELGGTIFVREMMALEREILEKSVVIMDKDGNVTGRRLEGYRSLVVALTVCDEKGIAIFTPNDVAQIGQWPASVVDRIVEKAQNLASISQRDVEEMTQNF